MKHTKWLIVCGCLLAATATMLSRYPAIPDSLKGFIFGLGIGLGVLALIIYRKTGRASGKQ